MSGVVSLRRVSVVVALTLVLVALLLRQETYTGHSASAASAPPITGLCAGQKQGVIKGDVTLKGREGTYGITALSHSIVSPRDPASGLPTGKRQHKPITITTDQSSATPKLITALIDNENLPACIFNFWRADASGRETNYYRIVLTNASIASYTLNGRPGGADTVTYSLTYQKIQWTFIKGGISASDDWESPVS